MARKFLEVDPELKKDVQLFCFLNERTERSFANEAVRKMLEPYEHWLVEVRKLHHRRPPVSP